MCIFTGLSENFGKRQKKYLIMSFVLIILVSILEVISIIVDGSLAQYRIINVISNYLGFGLTPAVPICIALALDNDLSATYAIGVEILYLIFLMASLPFEWVFLVNENNLYARGTHFWIYLVAYLGGIIYMLIMTLQFGKKYQSRSRIMVYPIVIFLIIGTSIQVFFPQIRVTWLCVTMLSIVFYIYCNEMCNQLDGLTGLLNQKSYLNRTAIMRKNGTLVVFDVDDFKSINDRYGHLMGDRCLCEIAECIKKVYFKKGYCYRIGGDEFCVLLNENVDAQACYKELIKYLDMKRKSLQILPFVSIGIEQFSIGSDAIEIKENADQNMYQYKKEYKRMR